jgi:hypothetical protein
MDMTLEVTGTLRQRYAECKAASKVFKMPLLKMAFVWVRHVNHVKCDVFGAGVLGGAERYRECDGLDWFNYFPIKTIEGLRRFRELLSVKTHFVEGC